jgi:hypothetical protein
MHIQSVIYSQFERAYRPRVHRISLLPALMLTHNCILIRRILTQMGYHRTKIMKLSSLELRYLRKQFLTVSPQPLAIQLPLSQLLHCSRHKSLVLLQTNSAFRAEGMRIVDPGRKSISRPGSQREMRPSTSAEDASIPSSLLTLPNLVLASFRGESCSSTAEDLRLL